MKRILIATTLVAALLSAPAVAQVSVSIGQPGFYGRIDIGGYPPPPLLYPEPVVIHRGPVFYEPIYLRVPPGHAKQWKRYCNSYHACGRPVYFVQDDWYRHEYAPRYRERHGHRHDDHRDHRERHDDHDHHDDHGKHGKGHDQGKGHKHGHD
ncbi:MAG TPA: hypothetical protein VF096_12690 [Azonexus sp.]